MEMEKQTIYSKRYNADWSALEKDAEKKTDDDLAFSLISPTAEEFIEGIHNMRYESKEGAIEHAFVYVRLVKALSTFYMIDVDIYKTEDSVGIILYMNEAMMSGELKLGIATLMKECSEVNIWSNRPGYDFEIEFTFYTHDAYLFGRKLLRD